MYNVLIVDDEPGIIEGLEILINWKEYGFRVLSIAANGKEALEKLSENRHNLIITDIRMPVLDGLELIKAIRSLNPTIKIIIISGYNDFTYAKRAIELGVKAYLLKPIIRTELIEIVQDLKKELDSELEQAYVTKENRDITRDRFLYDLCNGRLNIQEIKDRSEKCEVSMKEGTFNVALLEIEGYFETMETDLEGAKLLKFSVKNVVEELLTEYGNAYVYEDSEAVLGIVYMGQYIDLTAMDACLTKIYNCLLEYIHVTATIGYGTPIDNVLDMGKCRKQALRALNGKIIAGNKSIIPFQFVAPKEEATWQIEWDSNKLFFSLETFDQVGVNVEINRFVEEIIKKRLTPKIIQGLLYEIVFGICALLKKFQGDKNRIFSNEDLTNIQVKNFNEEQLKEWLFNVCVKSINYVGELQEQKSERSIYQIKKYIEENYSEELSLKSIAAKFYLNPAYTGQLLKKALGENFNEYLNRIRITNAKMLMNNSDIKIYEIIEKVGYKNPNYFYTLFTRYEGITFAEYRGRVRKGKGI